LRKYSLEWRAIKSALVGKSLPAWISLAALLGTVAAAAGVCFMLARFTFYFVMMYQWSHP